MVIKCMLLVERNAMVVMVIVVAMVIMHHTFNAEKLIRIHKNTQGQKVNCKKSYGI